MVLNVQKNMCALFVSAGNGNACTQMSQDRQRGEENCKIERLGGINLSIDSDGTRREFYKAWIKVANLHTACLGIEKSHFR